MIIVAADNAEITLVQLALNRDGANAKFIRKLRCFFQVSDSPDPSARNTRTSTARRRTKVASLGRSLFCQA
jgi:hypothetical protein